MIKFIEILKIALPSCITGMITFFITKYNFHQNTPLDKYEFAYNRIYYPIYRLLMNNTPIQELVIKSRQHLVKYNKYADRTTLIAFLYLEKYPYQKKAQNNFNDNIVHINSKLRHRLGYLEPNILNMYTYSSPTEKRFARIIIELMLAYLSLLAFSTLGFKIIKDFSAIVFAISFVSLILEIAIVLFLFIKNKISNDNSQQAN